MCRFLKAVTGDKSFKALAHPKILQTFIHLLHKRNLYYSPNTKKEITKKMASLPCSDADADLWRCHLIPIFE